VTPKGRTAGILIDGQNTSFDNCHFSSKGSFAGPLLEAGSIVTGAKADGIAITNCYFWYQGRIVLDGTRVTFANNVFKYSLGSKSNILQIDGIYINAISNMFYITANTTSLNEVILLGGRYNTLDSNVITALASEPIPGHGIHVIGYNCNLRGNVLHQIKRNGIWVDNQAGVLIANNRISYVGREDDTLYDGILLSANNAQNVRANVISGNILEAHGRTNIRLEDISGDILGIPAFRNTAITGNSVYGTGGNAARGIANGNHGNATGSNNLVENNMVV
jgi:parallel beta-helix repeat protein